MEESGTCWQPQCINIPQISGIYALTCTFCMWKLKIVLGCLRKLWEGREKNRWVLNRKKHQEEFWVTGNAKVEIIP